MQADHVFAGIEPVYLLGSAVALPFPTAIDNMLPFILYSRKQYHAKTKFLQSHNSGDPAVLDWHSSRAAFVGDSPAGSKPSSGGRQLPGSRTRLSGSLAQAVASGKDESTLAQPLNNLGAVLYQLGRYAEAEPILRRAEIAWHGAGPASTSGYAATLSNLAALYNAQGRYTDTESLLLKSIAMRESLEGAQSVELAIPLNNLADLYRNQAKFQQAELLINRALELAIASLGPEHPTVAHIYHTLAVVRRDQGRNDEAEVLAKRF